MRAEPATVGLLRTSGGEQSVRPGSVQPVVRPTPEFATGPYDRRPFRRDGLVVATRKDERPDAQSSAIFDAHYLRLSGATDARFVRLNAHSVRRTRNHPGPAHDR